MSTLSIKRIIELRTPEFAADLRIDDMITLASSMTGSEFGDLYNQAVALRVMHWFAKEKQSGGNSSNSGSVNSGRVINEKEGQLSVSYQSSSNSKWEDLTSTRFGSELVELMSCLILPRIRRGEDEVTVDDIE